MEWQFILLLILGSFLVLMLTGLPVAFCFLLINLVGVMLLWGGETGLRQLVLSINSSLATFVLLPIPLFILMGEVMFRSGVAGGMLDALDKWLGALPGRLGLLAVVGGTLIATLSGSSMASTAMLGSLLTPEMESRGYKKPMSLGPILGSGGLAIMIPPSALAVLLGAIGELSIGKILIGIVIPGLLMAIFYATYIIGRCFLQPSVAPAYSVRHVPMREKLVATVQHILPTGGIVFLVVGVIFLGIGTPTEAAGLGTIGAFILAAGHRRLNWKIVRDSVIGALEITVVIFMIIAGAKAYSQILAFSGATRELIEFALAFPISPIFVIVVMQIVVLFLGMFMSVTAIMMITLPIFVPIVVGLGFSEVWFAVIFLLNIEMAMTSPPFGMSLFVMKSAAPPDTTLADCYRAALPFLYCDVVVMALMIAFPILVLWLPRLML